MESFTFTTDHAGETLDKPVTLLLADAGLVAELEPAAALCCFVHEDATGDWEESPITPDAPRAFVRAFGFHRDAETGIDHVFAGTGRAKSTRGQLRPCKHRAAFAGSRNPSMPTPTSTAARSNAARASASPTESSTLRFRPVCSSARMARTRSGSKSSAGIRRSRAGHGPARHHRRSRTRRRSRSHSRLPRTRRPHPAHRPA